MNAVFDPYMYGFLYENESELPREQRKFGRLNKMRIDNGKGLARLKSTSYSISPSFNQDTFREFWNKLTGNSGDNSKSDESKANPNGDDVTETQPKSSLRGTKSKDETDDDGYVTNKLLWTFGFNFMMSYGYDLTDIDYEKMEYKGKFNVNNSIGFNGSIQPTKNWSMNFYGNYNLEQKTLTNMTLSLSRNLHCWTMSANIQPIGTYKTYYVSIRANSSMLQDLRKSLKDVLHLMIPTGTNKTKYIMISSFPNYLIQHEYTSFDLKAVLFDMDGVLFDSMKWHAKSWKETMDKYNIPSEESEYYLHEGMVGFNTIRLIIEREQKEYLQKKKLMQFISLKQIYLDD